MIWLCEKCCGQNKKALAVKKMTAGYHVNNLTEINLVKFRFVNSELEP